MKDSENYHARKRQVQEAESVKSKAGRALDTENSYEWLLVDPVKIFKEED